MVEQNGAQVSSLLVQLFPSLIIALILAVPFVRILRRAGRSSWWALLLLVPVLGWLILPWLIAFLPWERSEKQLDEVFR